MEDKTEGKKPDRVQNRRVHMANERTFLAWIRTSIGIMAFGFVMEKFALFVRQMGCFLNQTGPGGKIPSSSGFNNPREFFDHRGGSHRFGGRDGSLGLYPL